MQTLDDRGRVLGTQVTWLPDGFRKSWHDARKGHPAQEAVSMGFWVGHNAIRAGVGLFDVRRMRYHPLANPMIERWALVSQGAKPFVLPSRVFDQLTHNGSGKK